MKKITLLLICLFMVTSGMAQTISFEAAEGYSLGDVNGQNNWTTSLSSVTGNPITNQLISAEQSTDGSNALKLNNEPAFGIQGSANTGAFYDYGTNVDVTSAVFTFDIYIDAQGLIEDDISDHVVAFRNGITNITYVVFTFSGGIALLTNERADGNGIVDFEFASETWSPNTWHSIRVEINNPNVELFIDGASTPSVSAFVATPNLDVNRAAFAHSNYESAFFIDNFTTDDSLLSIEDEVVASEDYRYLGRSQELLLKNASESLENIAVYNLLGQQVLSQSLSGNEARLNLQNLSNGIYVAQITAGDSVQTLKFAK